MAIGRCVYALDPSFIAGRIDRIPPLTPDPSPTPGVEEGRHLPAFGLEILVRSAGGEANGGSP